MKTECYGHLFPEVDKLEFNKPCTGEVFSVTLTRHGFGSIQSREMDYNKEKWDACTQCDRYQSCYDLSMAKLSLWSAINAGYGD